MWWCFILFRSLPKGTSTLRLLEGPIGAPLAWPVSEAWIKTHNALDIAGGSQWRKQMSVCGHKRVPVEHVILFFVFRGLCFWSVSIMKRFRRCADPCQRFWHQMTHTTYALGGKHARSVLEGMECVHCEPFSLGKAPLSFVPFLERIAAIADGACEWVWESNFHLALHSGWRE